MSAWTDDPSHGILTAPMRVHVVKQGECLSSIAHACGFASYKPVYEHADNADFRKKRPDPAVIFPGDEIAIRNH